MADQFPSWWSVSAHSEPRLFDHPNEVPPGWTLRVGTYDHEIGQFVTAEQAEKRDAKKRKLAKAQEPSAAEIAAAAPAESVVEIEDGNVSAPAKARPKAGAHKKGTDMEDEPKAVNEDEKGIRKPQDDETPSDVNDPANVARERGTDGTVRTGNRPTRR